MEDERLTVVHMTILTSLTGAAFYNMNSHPFIQIGASFCAQQCCIFLHSMPNLEKLASKTLFTKKKFLCLICSQEQVPATRGLTALTNDKL